MASEFPASAGSKIPEALELSGGRISMLCPRPGAWGRPGVLWQPIGASREPRRCVGRVCVLGSFSGLTAEAAA